MGPIGDVAAGQDSPVLSVVVPTHDNAAGAVRTLRAVLAQISGRDDVELIVVDDGSTDDTPAAVRAELKTTPEGRTATVVEMSNGGPSAARNRGLRDARGRLVAFVDANDEPLAGWVEHFTSQPDAGIVHCRPAISDPTLDLTYAWMLPGCFAARRDVLEAVGGYDEALWFAENSDLVERVHATARSMQLDVAHSDDVLLAVHDITDSRRYDSRRVDAMLHLLHRDVGKMDPQTAERYARVGAVTAARCGRIREARYLAWQALKARPLNLRNWLRLAAVSVPALGRRRWGGS